MLGVGGSLGPLSSTAFRAPRRRVSVASVVGNLLTNRPFEHGFMVLQDLGIRQTSVVIGRNDISADRKVANSGYTKKYVRLCPDVRREPVRHG